MITVTDFTSKTVLRGFMAAWFLAASPIRRSFSLKETYEGVVKLPCSLAMISTLCPSYVATHEYVVPIKGRALSVNAENEHGHENNSLRRHTQVDANGTIVNLFRHGDCGSGEDSWTNVGGWR
jgi:hypothetical protein